MLFKDVRVQIALPLFLVSLLSLIRLFSLQLLFSFLAIIALGQIVEIIFVSITKKKYYFSFSVLITSLLIFLIMDNKLPLWLPFITLIIAISSKYLLKIGPKHIFNPAAFGIFIASIFSKTTPSWWGVSWNIWLSLIVIFGSIYTLFKLRRLYFILGFLVIYLAYTFFIIHQIGLSTLFDGTLILFSFVMLTEPQTTPAAGYSNKAFGVIAGLLMVLYLKFLPSFEFDPFLISLLTANLAIFLLNIKPY